MLQCKCRENCNICFRTEEELLIAAACQVQLQQQSRGTAAAAAPAFLHTTLELQIKLQPAVPRMQLQLLSPAAQKCISNCSCSCPKEPQLAATNCSCSCPKVAATPAFPPPRLKVHRKQPLVLMTMACNCSSIGRLMSFCLTASETAVKAAASFSEAEAAHSAVSARTAVELQSDYVVIIFGNGVQSWLEFWFYQSQRFCTTAHTYIELSANYAQLI